MTKDEITATLNLIEIALMACNNCVATDDPDANPDERSWRINNCEALDAMAELRRFLDEKLA